jgi:hypothetical protein
MLLRPLVAGLVAAELDAIAVELEKVETVAVEWNLVRTLGVER